MKSRAAFAAWAAAVLLLAIGCGFRTGPVLPAPEALRGITITASELELTATGGDFIAEFLQMLEQNARKNTGRGSVRDAPSAGAGLVRVDFIFKEGGISTLFLYQEDRRLLLEQPYRGIYEMDISLEALIRRQIARELARLPAVEETIDRRQIPEREFDFKKG